MIQGCACPSLTLQQVTTRLSVGCQTTSKPALLCNTTRRIEERWQAIPGKFCRIDGFEFDSLVWLVSVLDVFLQNFPAKRHN